MGRWKRKRAAHRAAHGAHGTRWPSADLVMTLWRENWENWGENLCEMSQKCLTIFHTKKCLKCNRKLRAKCCLSMFKLYYDIMILMQLQPLRLHVEIELESVNSKRDFESIYFKLKLTWFKLTLDSSQWSTNECQQCHISFSLVSDEDCTCRGSSKNHVRGSSVAIPERCPKSVGAETDHLIFLWFSYLYWIYCFSELWYQI